VDGQAASAVRASSTGNQGETDESDRWRYCRDAAHDPLLTAARCRHAEASGRNPAEISKFSALANSASACA